MTKLKIQMINGKCQMSTGCFHIPGANIKEFLEPILSELKPMQIPRLSKDGEFSEGNAPDQKFFSVSGMGFGEQPVKVKMPNDKELVGCISLIGFIG